MRMKVTITATINLDAINYPPLSTPQDILKIEEDNLKEASLDEYLGDVEKEMELVLLD